MIIEILLSLGFLFALVYWYITKSFGKWENLGIPHVTAHFPYGSYNLLSQERHLTDMAEEDYKKFRNEKVYGWFLFGKPVLMINDLEILKHVEVKAFDHFVDRNDDNTNKAFGQGGKMDQLWGKQLTGASGEAWKNIRSAFTPIFTSGKMKIMLKFIKHVAGDLTNEFEQKAKHSDVAFELKEVFGKFSLDALASAAFGVNAESFSNNDSVFVKNAARLFVNSKQDVIMFSLKLLPGITEIFRILNINVFKPKETRFFVDIVTKTLKHRRQSGERRNDLVDLMMDCIKEDSLIEEDDNIHAEDQYENDMKFAHKSNKQQLDEDAIVATAMVLLVAGYDTTGMLLSYLCYQMSKNQEVQEKLQEEIDQAFADSNGKFPDYNSIQNLPYLDMVIHETLRWHPPVGTMFRTCTKDYALPGTNITLKKNDMVTFFTTGIHKNPEFYSHPDQFYPEHFSKEEKASRSPYAFQAFGQGPRACIGMRFALLEAKVAVLSVLSKFSFRPDTTTQEPLVIDPQNQLNWAQGGLWAKVVKRDE